MTNNHARKSQARRLQQQTGASYSSSVAGTLHDHTSPDNDGRIFAAPYFSEPFETPADCELVGRLYDAALAGCRSCREALLVQVAAKAGTTAAVVAWAVEVASDMDFLEDLTESPALPRAWRTLAAAWMNSGSALSVAGPSAAMSAEERRHAAAAATDVVLAMSHHSRSETRPVGDIRYCPVCDGDDDGRSDTVLLANGPGVMDIVQINDPVLALAERVYTHLRGDLARNRSADLYRALRSLLEATGAGADASYRDQLEDFAVGEHQRLSRLLPQLPGGARMQTSELLAHPMVIIVCERLEAAGPRVREVWDQHLPGHSLAAVAERWDGTRPQP